ncbi:hypothetical protein ACFOEK_02305 [Litoribrevibacter euphylliae]|uniref:Flagellar hook-length control protein FliK n=1 Tax=Litoribrevibacter euphylliae TaxID=1834034 RepID=A0ABV7H7G6_9GAMM
MQSVFQPGQFRLAAIQPSQQNSNAQELLSSVSPNQTLKADVLSATLQQISQQVNQQQQTIAQYKAQIIIQGKVLDILTQFPLDQGDQLELKVTQDKQLTIDKVTPQSQRTDSAVSPIDPKSLLNTGKVLTSAAEQASLINNKASSTSNTATPSPITAEQINKVIQMWLSQSRPSSGVLLDLSITMEAVAEIIKQLPNAPQLNPLQINPTSGSEQVKASPLSNLLLVIAQSIQKDIFSRLPHAGQNDFKSNVQQLIKELITWQPQDSNAKTVTTNQPSHPAHTQVHAVAQGQTTQQTLINSLITLQSMIDQALNRSTLTTQPSAVSNAVHSGIQALSNTTETGAFNTPPSTTQPAPQLSILRDWTQVLALMAPTTQSQPDLLDWMLESIRRLAGTQAPSDISTATNKPTQEALTQAKAATQNPSNAQATNPQLLNTETHRAIDSSQWLRLAEFRKHQLFTGNVKQSLLQGTTDLQINNVLRQMLVNVEELTGRMSAMRLASGGSQVETNTPNHIHLDLPIITNTGPTNVSIDITDEHSNTSESGDNTKKEKNQWLVHLKFELPPLAPFIGQIIYDTDKNHLTANFYSDHQETLSLLNEHLIDLETQCQSFLASELSLNTRFGMINMPRESIVKTTNHSVSVKV